MKLKELIETLQEYDPTLEVVVELIDPNDVDVTYLSEPGGDVELSCSNGAMFISGYLNQHLLYGKPFPDQS